MDETRDFLWQVHWECDQFAKVNNPEKEAPKSVGHYFQQRFQHWLNTDDKCKDDDPDSRAWRNQFYNWFIKFEECDSGCDNLFKQSSISWGEYIDYDEDTNLANGFKSVLDVMVAKLKAAKVKIFLQHEVLNIDYDKTDFITITCKDKSDVFVADHVLVTVSLGVLKKHHKSMFTPILPSRTIDVINSISFGTIDRIKLDFESAFWDLDDPGLMILWNNEDLSDQVTDSNWVKFIYGYDEIIYHPSTLMGWVSGKAARYIETLSDETIAEAICQHLQSVMSKFKNDPGWTLPKLRRIVMTRWHSNPNFRGVYSYRNQTSDLQGITNKDLSEPVSVNGCPRILFGGEATDREHYGTVHGAMSAAVREVDRLEAFWKNN